MISQEKSLFNYLAACSECDVLHPWNPFVPLYKQRAHYWAVLKNVSEIHEKHFILEYETFSAFRFLLPSARIQCESEWFSYWSEAWTQSDPSEWCVGLMPVSTGVQVCASVCVCVCQSVAFIYLFPIAASACNQPNILPLCPGFEFSGMFSRPSIRINGEKSFFRCGKA